MQIERVSDQFQLTFDAIFYKQTSVNSHKRLLNLFPLHGPLSLLSSPQVTAQTTVQM